MTAPMADFEVVIVLRRHVRARTVGDAAQMVGNKIRKGFNTKVVGIEAVYVHRTGQTGDAIPYLPSPKGWD